MGLAIWALAAYLAIIIVWAVPLKRGIGEAMVVAFLALCLFGGAHAPSLVALGLRDALQQPVVFAALSFVFVGFLLGETGIIHRQVDILSSLLGRVSGGPGYVATLASAGFGALTHSAAANAATIGSVTVPWMKRSNFSPRAAATIIAGNSGNGTVIPPSAPYLIIIGLASVAPHIDAGSTLLTMFLVAGCTVAWRMLCVHLFVRRGEAGAPDQEGLAPLRRSWAAGWRSLLVYLGILVPLLLAIAPGPAVLARIYGGASSSRLLDAIEILVWMPVLLGAIGVLVARRSLPQGRSAWIDFGRRAAPRYKDIGATLVFSFAGSAVLLDLGLDEQLKSAISALHAPALVTILLVVIIIVLVGGPLSATATAATIGGASFAILTAVGVHPSLAVASILVAISTADASPPGGPAIYLGSGIAQVNPARTFVPLIVLYVVPFIVFAVAVAMGAVPVL